MSVNTIERAFQLAKSGRYGTIDDLRRALDAERCMGVVDHLSGPSLRRDLLRLMKAARDGRIKP